MQNFEHFLITRFNVKLKEWLITKQGEDVTSKEWLEHRFDLFETYCYPSIKQQTNLNFKWLVFFDNQTPKYYREKIQALHEEFLNFTPIYIDDANEIHTIIRKAITFHSPKDITHIITSRLDNDDGLHNKFIETVHNHFIPKPSFLIEITDGFQLILKSNKTNVIREVTAPLNPFLSLIEDKTNFKTILSRKHLDWKGHPHKTISKQALWLQVIHNKNISNNEKIHFKETNAIRLSDFGIKKEIKLKSKVNIALSTIITNFKRLFLKLKLIKS